MLCLVLLNRNTSLKVISDHSLPFWLFNSNNHVKHVYFIFFTVTAYTTPHGLTVYTATLNIGKLSGKKQSWADKDFSVDIQLRIKKFSLLVV